MSKEAYKAFCGDLVRNFDKDWVKVGPKFDFGWKFLEHIPENAWKQMIPIAINLWDGWPRNWIKAVKEVYETWRRDGGLGSNTNYNRDNDVRFPVALMHKASDILQERGYLEYSAYCDSVGMPKTDRDRVEFKHKVIKGHQQPFRKLPSIGQRINPERPRPAVQKYREPGEN
jgi:hypothetical protein